MIKLIECPRDAMQGMKEFVPTEKKIEYINLLLRVGFDTLDFGSFVSPKAIPQLRDTKEVLSNLNLTGVKSKLLSIVANVRGAEEACEFEVIDYLGFPLSVSETFQRRNTNSSIADSLKNVAVMQSLCSQTRKKLVVYLSMGFGNPYGDSWSSAIVGDYAMKLADLGIEIISIADTVGVSKPELIRDVFTNMPTSLRHVEIGAHLHSTPDTWREKIDAAYASGCLRFDSAMNGFGGCPMADDDLVGNIATENIISYFKEKNINLHLDETYLPEIFSKASKIFVTHS